MTTERRFLIPSSIARLIQRDQGTGVRVAEGHFSSNPNRSQFVRVDAEGCHLVLLSRGGEGTSAQERTEIPRSQAEALLDVRAGKIAYDRSSVRLLPGSEVLLDRVMTPRRVDLVTVILDEGSSRQFDPPPWFGPEVTDDPAYQSHSIAVNGLPEAEDVALSNAALEALLDAIEQAGSVDSSERAQRGVRAEARPDFRLSGEKPATLPSPRSELNEPRAETPADTLFPETSSRDEVLDGMMASLARVLVKPASPNEDEARNLVEVFNSAPRPSRATSSVNRETRQSAGLA